MVSNWFPRGEVASAIGVANAGTPLGGALAGPVAGWIALTYGWRASFIVLGLIGLVWTSLWVAIAVERPDVHPRLTEAERAEIESDREQQQQHRKLPLTFYLPGNNWDLPLYVSAASTSAEFCSGWRWTRLRRSRRVTSD